MAAVHVDKPTSSVRVRITCEFHSYEQLQFFCVWIVFLSNPYDVNNTKFILILFIQAMTSQIMPLLNCGARLVKLLTM